MQEKDIIEQISVYLGYAQKELSCWLSLVLPRVSKDWWRECVLDNLTKLQKSEIDKNGFTKLEQLDLTMLLRVTEKSWYAMSSFAYLNNDGFECIKAMERVNYSCTYYHNNGIAKDSIIKDINAILYFFNNILENKNHTEALFLFKNRVENMDFKSNVEDIQTDIEADASEELDIRPKDIVYLVSNPSVNGAVITVGEVDGLKSYDVFVGNGISTFYEGQIKKAATTSKPKWIDLSTLKSQFTAYAINKPSSNNLYSLNAARIDFVPYQFRPALKLIKSDEPKILIADSVGVGKTIEAGLLIKELEARTELENIAIICPKPLVAERKWELEMKRFDEDFTQLDGPSLQRIIDDADAEGEWSSKYNKVIIPYSILNDKIYNGDKRGGRKYGLLDLDPAPHFDLVIIDEAHHIRNGSMEKEKAYAYKCVRYFCEHADAVVMLTATPLQTSDNDLYTLLNLLRPDVVIDKEIFTMMSKPNEYIYRCSHAVRGGIDGWQEEAYSELQAVKKTQWGENVIARNPLYKEVLKRLQQKEITREERVKLISDIESLHSFNNMLNRTRRRDIQDFCIRRPFTIEVEFTPLQAELHDELLRFEAEALAKLHDPRFVPFMMSTLKRQAASCIFGLAPYINSLVDRRFAQMSEEMGLAEEEVPYNDKAASALYALSQRVLALAKNLPEEDPKLDSVIRIIEDKQKQANNKIILFSSFRHTLNYLYTKLSQRGYRVAQINGSIKDEERRDLRARFELDRSDPEALDLLLFTEVGSEGLDYQFCDTMINYDLPWNPMRIEQRIGRIDRRGQKSEAVSIYNIITPNTVDADVYDRCLMRIGVFERSIGECEEILSSITSSIERIASSQELSAIERREKLEQIADNEIRHMQEMTQLEDEERALFGFDLSDYTTSEEIKEAENPWLSANNLHMLVERYLEARLGKKQYISGMGSIKLLSLEKEERVKLLEDLRSIANDKYISKKKWEAYLKGKNAKLGITFQSEAATRDRRLFFITPMHPLVQQAAKYFANDETSYIHLEYYSEGLPEGRYTFSVYTWNYVGIQPSFKLKVFCENEEVSQELLNIIQVAGSGRSIEVEEDAWRSLEKQHVEQWQEEKQRYLLEIGNIANYKLESLKSNYINRKRNLEQRLMESSDSKIERMHRSELNTATENYNAKVQQIKDKASKADIYTELIVKGVIDIKRG